MQCHTQVPSWPPEGFAAISFYIYTFTDIAIDMCIYIYVFIDIEIHMDQTHNAKDMASNPQKSQYPNTT